MHYMFDEGMGSHEVLGKSNIINDPAGIVGN